MTEINLISQDEHVEHLPHVFLLLVRAQGSRILERLADLRHLLVNSLAFILLIHTCEERKEKIGRKFLPGEIRKIFRREKNKEETIISSAFLLWRKKNQL